jgi:putative transposase
MPWMETRAMDERVQFVLAASEAGAVMSQVCASFGVSRQTGYVWLKRYEAEGVAGLADRSRAPLAHGRMHGWEVRQAAMALKDRYPHWGPKKLRVKLAELQGWSPAASTLGEWYRSEGLTNARRRRRSCEPYNRPFAAALEPNDVWCVDFKGWFRTGDGARCDPLTLSDAFSRYLLACRRVDRPDHEHVRPLFEAAFAKFGLPAAIRSDNGPPFASTAAGGLSALSLWWTKLGIDCERIEPGKPQQNGRHERMHLTLKQETAQPPAASLAEQDERFEVFLGRFNHERPHEALAQKTPASLYRRSARAWPCRLIEITYPDNLAVRRVRSNGEIKWGGQFVFVSQVLVGELVAIAETEAGDWQVRFAHIVLGYIDVKRRRLCRKPLRGAEPACGFVDDADASPTTPQANNNHQSVSDVSGL